MAHAEVLQPGMNWSGLDSLPNFTEVKTSPAPQQERNTWSCLATSSSVLQGTIQPFHFPFELLSEPSANSNGVLWWRLVLLQEMAVHRTKCPFTKHGADLKTQCVCYSNSTFTSFRASRPDNPDWWENLDKMIQGKAPVVANTSKLLSENGFFWAI